MLISEKYVEINTIDFVNKIKSLGLKRIKHREYGIINTIKLNKRRTGEYVTPVISPTKPAA